MFKGKLLFTFDLFSFYDDRFDIADVQWMVSETADMFQDAAARTLDAGIARTALGAR